jgi:hypothetical protein
VHVRNATFGKSRTHREARGLSESIFCRAVMGTVNNVAMAVNIQEGLSPATLQIGLLPVSSMCKGLEGPLRGSGEI